MAMSSHGALTKLFALVQQQAGLSRRKAQELIAAGEVSVEGQIVRDPFSSVPPHAVSLLRVRGHPLSLHAAEHRVYRYHKPAGMLCSHDDPHEGNTVGRVLRAEGFIGYTWAGRLDQDAEGLLLISNDGELIHRLSHPRFEVVKTYHVRLRRTPNVAELRRLFAEMRRGVHSEGDLLRIQTGTLAGTPPHPVVQLCEGKKREVKRLFS
ncbi:MAG TPA: rRNA pseudouridine synthase, partial [Candidatus Hydrogenedentes bacterium]|nr:rRNA pseudouridine synthase [Candidatus Hydrogenedentota bacterium]